MERSRDFLLQAKRDLEQARLSLREGFFEWAAFAAQQAAEKAVKAVFQRLGAVAWGHSVAGLLEASATAGPRYRELAGLYARRFLLGEDYPPEALGARALYLPEGGA